VQPLASTPLAFAAIVGTGALGSAVSMPSISPLYLDHVDAEERAVALAMRQVSPCGCRTFCIVATQCRL